jgi:hypothetical protein
VVLVWPTTLPQTFLASGYGEATPDKNVITDEYNVGPPVYRRRTTSAPAPFAGQMFMTTAEWEALSTFFHTDLFDGVMRFLFPPQAVADTGRFWISRFVIPPTRQMSDVDDGWLVSLSLEKLGIGEVFLSPAMFSDPDTFYSPTVIYDQVAAAALYTDADLFYGPVLSFDQTITASLYSNSNTFYAPSITLPAYVVVSFAEVEANT